MRKTAKIRFIYLYRFIMLLACGALLCTGCQKQPEQNTRQNSGQEEREVIDLGLSDHTDLAAAETDEGKERVNQKEDTEETQKPQENNRQDELQQEAQKQEELEKQEQIRLLGELLLEETETQDGIAFPEKPMQQLYELSPEHASQMQLLRSYWESIETPTFLNEDRDVSGIPEDNSVCFVVLGYQLKADGTMRKELIGRLETALDMANRYPDSYILVTGGGTAPGNADITEAGSMAQWLLDNGLNEKRIIIENQSMTTAENALFSHQILEKDYPEIRNIVMVTSDYHVVMGCLLFEAQALWTEGESKKPHVITNVPYDSNRDYSFSREELKYWLENLYQLNFPEMDDE